MEKLVDIKTIFPFFRFKSKNRKKKNWLTLKSFFHFSNLSQKIEKWSNDVNETMSSFFHFFLENRKMKK